MKVSFVIPAYNESGTIDTCLRALLSEISRYHYDAEVLVVNNASTDDTKEKALRHKGVLVVDETQKGIVFARKAGFVRSTGELIANIDADSKVPEGWLAMVMTSFEKDPELLALSGPLVYFDAPFYIRFWTRLFYIAGYIINAFNGMLFRRASMLQGGNFVIRRSALEAIGGYDTSIEFYGEDTDIGRRISEIGKVVWTFTLPMHTSGRRLMKEGLLKTGCIYALNYVSITFTKKPATRGYTDIRM